LHGSIVGNWYHTIDEAGVCQKMLFDDVASMVYSELVEIIVPNAL